MLQALTASTKMAGASVRSKSQAELTAGDSIPLGDSLTTRARLAIDDYRLLAPDAVEREPLQVQHGVADLPSWRTRSRRDRRQQDESLLPL